MSSPSTKNRDVRSTTQDRPELRWANWHRFSAPALVTPYMFLGTGTMDSSIHVAGRSGGGIRASPKTVVDEVITNARTFAAAAASSMVLVPLMLVSTNA